VSSTQARLQPEGPAWAEGQERSGLRGIAGGPAPAGKPETRSRSEAVAGTGPGHRGGGVCDGDAAESQGPLPPAGGGPARPLGDVVKLGLGGYTEGTQNVRRSLTGLLHTGATTSRTASGNVWNPICQEIRARWGAPPRTTDGF